MSNPNLKSSVPIIKRYKIFLIYPLKHKYQSPFSSFSDREEAHQDIGFFSQQCSMLTSSNRTTRQPTKKIMKSLFEIKYFPRLTNTYPVHWISNNIEPVGRPSGSWSIVGKIREVVVTNPNRSFFGLKNSIRLK